MVLDPVQNGQVLLVPNVLQLGRVSGLGSVQVDAVGAVGAVGHSRHDCLG